MLCYLDTSAFVKLVMREDYSAHLLDWVRTTNAHFVSSDLMSVEAQRAARRHSARALAGVRERLGFVTLIRLTPDICARASKVDPAIMRSLDALHLATALEFGDALSGVVTYDARMSDAAALLGLEVLAPGHPQDDANVRLP